MGYLMPKPSFQKNSCGTLQPITEKDNGVHAFTIGICLKVNVIVRLEFKLAYFVEAVQHNSQYTTETFPYGSTDMASPWNKLISLIKQTSTAKQNRKQYFFLKT